MRRGLRSLCRTLARMKVTLVAIERPDGLLVERLLDAGLRLLALHPNQVAAARPRFRAAGGKSDRFDAFVLCELARTDHHRFRVLEPDSDQTKALRAMTRAREDLVQSRVALANQLRAELERFWPGPIGLFSDLDNLISLAFLKRYPSPADARGLGEQRLQAFLTRERYSGHKPPAKLLAKLRRAPEGRAGTLECQARRAVVLSLVAALEPIVEAIHQLERQIATAIREHPDGEIFLSLFRSPRSVITAARVAGAVARPGSHRTVRTLVVYGSSGRRVMTPAAGRLIDLESSPQRQLRRLGGDDLPGRVAVKVDQEDQPTLGEVRVAQGVIDGRSVAERPRRLLAGVDGT
jgi:transposase